MIQRQVQEILEALWSDVELEKDKAPLTSLRQLSGLGEKMKIEAVLKEAEANGLIKIQGEKLSLTELGKSLARDIVRRHRLAERLFYDVFDLSSDEVESSACRFEHLLSREATDSICILLGHPVTCPHGNPIPRGDCCELGTEQIRPLVIPANQLYPSEEATVAYLGGQIKDRLDRLANLGIVPGTKITLIQRQPNYVIRFGETELALDEAVLGDIWVRRLIPKLPSKTLPLKKRRS